MNNCDCASSTCVHVMEEDFDVKELYDELSADAIAGAVVQFVGLVRDFNQGLMVTGLTLEHYPGMTENALKDIARQAKERWALRRVTIIHRVGELELNDQIVYVGVSAQHREAAFAACDYIMDYLKNRAPFWKKENTIEGERWVTQEEKDVEALNKW